GKDGGKNEGGMSRVFVRCGHVVPLSVLILLFALHVTIWLQERLITLIVRMVRLTFLAERLRVGRVVVAILIKKIVGMIRWGCWSVGARIGRVSRGVGRCALTPVEAGVGDPLR